MAQNPLILSTIQGFCGVKIPPENRSSEKKYVDA